MDLFTRHALPIPHYLSAPDKRALFSELARWPENRNCYYVSGEEGLLQGDICDGLTVRDFDSGEKKRTRAIVISNSCDIDLTNAGHGLRSIIFSPVITLSRYVDSLKLRGLNQNQIEDTVACLKRQTDAHILFLPGMNAVLEESIVDLDDIHSQPLRTTLNDPPRCRVSLNQYGHYVFLVKLSIHFLRLQEGVSRTA